MTISRAVDRLVISGNLNSFCKTTKSIFIIITPGTILPSASPSNHNAPFKLVSELAISSCIIKETTQVFPFVFGKKECATTVRDFSVYTQQWCYSPGAELWLLVTSWKNERTSTSQHSWSTQSGADGNFWLKQNSIINNKHSPTVFEIQDSQESPTLVMIAGKAKYLSLLFATSFFLLSARCFSRCLKLTKGFLP